VVVLAKVWIRFKQLVCDVFGCHIVDQTYTLAGMSFRLFEAHLPVTLPTHEGHGKIKLYNSSKDDFTNMRKALVGGRCISENGYYKNIVCLDVKSLYPAAMAYYDQPYGQYRKVTGEVMEELGIYYCHVTPNKKDDHFGFFPLRKNNEVSYNQFDESYCAWYTSVDIAIGREEGHIIRSIPFEKGQKHVGYSWKHKGLIFKEYIENVLYKLKLEYEKTDQREHRQIIKLVMNSLWGKFAQKWMNTHYSIKFEGDPTLQNGSECHKIWDTDWFLVKEYNKKEMSDKPVQNGVFVLSWARYHMYQLWKTTVLPGTKCLYSDTDSMMIPANSIIPNASFVLNGNEISVIGDQMGQLEVETRFHELITVGKKQYMGVYGEDCTKPQYKKRFKGVPQEYIVPDMYMHLLESNENMVQVNFLKFKREWGSVSGYIESKALTQT
jgi:DNA polymerase elongation subunit (family B)